jgi:two-component system sensor histidine kinase BaeS
VTFRLRVFLLVMLVAVTAIGATAWLSLNLAGREFTASQVKAREARSDIRDAIEQHARTHGKWQGVASVARRLSVGFDVRIRLQAMINEEVVVDTDNLAGLAARPPLLVPVWVDPRPRLDNETLRRVTEDAARLGALPALRPPAVPADKAGEPADPPIRLVFPADLPAPAQTLVRARFGAQPVSLQRVLDEMTGYRLAGKTVDCLDRAAEPGSDGATFQNKAPYLVAPAPGWETCAKQATTEVAADALTRRRDEAALRACAGGVTNGQQIRCLESAFLERLSDVAPPPLQLFLGAVNANPRGMVGRPALLGLGALVLLAIIGTALVAGQVSRPVRRLTAASGLLAKGRLDVRVDVHGDGELAQLSTSFNRMAEAVQRGEERQRRLVADVAHELRTPLSNLRGYLEGLHDGVFEPSRELFASLLEETLLQRRILDDLQMLALAEVDGPAYARGPVDVAELTQVTGLAHRAVADEAGVTLTIEAPAPVLVDADPDRLRQVLGNLLSNAIRYTDSGGQVVVCATAAHGGALLTVSDTGTGIAREDLPRVFDRFWRADPARQRATGGSGLGLTIAKRIIDDHGGLIEVTSKLGEGTTFTVRLPPGAAVPPVVSP